MTKIDYDAKVNEIEKKGSDHNHGKLSPDFNNLGAGVFTVTLAREDLVTKTDFDTKLQSLSKRITSNKTEHLLVENELKKTTKV